MRQASTQAPLGDVLLECTRPPAIRRIATVRREGRADLRRRTANALKASRPTATREREVLGDDAVVFDYEAPAGSTVPIVTDYVEQILAANLVAGGPGARASILVADTDGEFFQTPFVHIDELPELFRRNYAHNRAEYDRDGVGIDTVSLEVLVPGLGVRGSTGNAAPVSNKTWSVIDPRATLNCAYHATVICLNWKKSPDVLVDAKKQRVRAMRLKNKVDPDDRNVVHAAEWQKIADTVGSTVKVRNTAFTVVETYKPAARPKKLGRGSRPVVNILRFGGHAYALVRKRALRNAGIAVPDPQPRSEVGGSLKDTAPIDVVVDTGKAPTTRVAAYDIETYKNEHGVCIPYAVGWAYEVDGVRKYWELWGEGCMQRFIEAIADADDPPLVWYAHNAARFDALPFLKALTKQDRLVMKPNGMIELNGIMQMRVEHTELCLVDGVATKRAVVEEAKT